MKKCFNLNTFFVVIVKQFGQSCKYCIMKYTGTIQSLVVVQCCGVGNRYPSSFPEFIFDEARALSAAGIKDGVYFYLCAYVLRITQGMA